MAPHTFDLMEEERPEVYERIPWETLDKKGGNLQWMVYAVAGAVVLGALAYSFMRNQPTVPPPPEAVATTAPVTTATSNMGITPSTVASPVVVAEADLYAVDPELLADQAAAHAEWFAVEYVAVDGAEQSRELLASLLPDGIPLPEAPEGTQVFVDWAGALSVTPTGPALFDVEILVRSLLSAGENGFVRQPPLVVGVEVSVGDDGRARVTGAPTLTAVDPASPAHGMLGEVPGELVARMETDYGTVIGGTQDDDGTWRVVVMSEGADGVRRPVTVIP